jgi:NAD(P)-dependent dehydrogenase (short-subunit alcohol dehydrogenase family)
MDGKVVVVTGAAQGLGATYARALAAEGAAVALVDVDDPAKVAGEIERAGGRALALTADVTRPESVAGMVERTISAFGRIDVLINNAALAGRLTLKPFTAIESGEWDAVMAVNVRGAFECAKAVVPHMRARRYGKIINVASGTAFKGTPLLMHYVASKGAVMAMTRALARELGDDGIRVNCLAPGLTLSENMRTNPDWSPSITAANIATRALKRDELPEDLVGAVLFLASGDSDFVTGQTIVVDGGSVMH